MKKRKAKRKEKMDKDLFVIGIMFILLAGGGFYVGLLLTPVEDRVDLTGRAFGGDLVGEAALVDKTPGLLEEQKPDEVSEPESLTAELPAPEEPIEFKLGHIYDYTIDGVEGTSGKMISRNADGIINIEITEGNRKGDKVKLNTYTREITDLGGNVLNSKVEPPPQPITQEQAIDIEALIHDSIAMNGPIGQERLIVSASGKDKIIIDKDGNVYSVNEEGKKGKHIANFDIDLEEFNLVEGAEPTPEKPLISPESLLSSRVRSDLRNLVPEEGYGDVFQTQLAQNVQQQESEGGKWLLSSTGYVGPGQFSASTWNSEVSYDLGKVPEDWDNYLQDNVKEFTGEGGFDNTALGKEYDALIEKYPNLREQIDDPRKNEMQAGNFMLYYSYIKYKEQKDEKFDGNVKMDAIRDDIQGFDPRLNPQTSVDATQAYLTSLHDRINDNPVFGTYTQNDNWDLATVAYNLGIGDLEGIFEEYADAGDPIETQEDLIKALKEKNADQAADYIEKVFYGEAEPATPGQPTQPVLTPEQGATPVGFTGEGGVGLSELDGIVLDDQGNPYTGKATVPDKTVGGHQLSRDVNYKDGKEGKTETYLLDGLPIQEQDYNLLISQEEGAVVQVNRNAQITAEGETEPGLQITIIDPKTGTQTIVSYQGYVPAKGADNLNEDGDFSGILTRTETKAFPKYYDENGDEVGYDEYLANEAKEDDKKKEFRVEENMESSITRVYDNGDIQYAEHTYDRFAIVDDQEKRWKETIQVRPDGQEIFKIVTPEGTLVFDCGTSGGCKDPVCEGDCSGMSAEDMEFYTKEGKQYGRRRFFGDIQRSLTQFRGLGGFSSLFIDDESLQAWREGVDKMFATLFLGTEYWSSAICSSKIETGQENLAYVETPDGLIGVAAHIEGERISQFNPVENKPSYIYKISYFVQNHPSSIASGGFRRSDKEMEFNVEVQGSLGRKEIYDNDIKLEVGQVRKISKDQLIVHESENLYDKVCIKFKTPIKTMGSGFSTESKDEVCNRFSSYAGGPTTVQTRTAGTTSGAGQGALTEDW